MKRIKKLLFLAICAFVMPLSYNAASLSMTITCPSTAAAGKNITCTIKATTSAANDISGLQADFDFDGATYVSNTIESNTLFTMPNSVNANGFMLGNNSGLPASMTLGKVTVTIPSSANPGDTFEIGLTNVKGTAKATYSDVNADDTYATVKIPSTDNTLSALTISEGELSPAFSATTTKYTATVASTVSSVTINATANHSGATVSGRGTKELAYGENIFTISVKSESGVTKKYTITITRTDDRDTTNTLSSLSVKGMSMKPAFAEATTAYTLAVDSTVTKVTIEATLKSDKSSFVKNYGPRSVSLNYGENKVQVRVQAENEKVKAYTITITRKDDRSTNNNLKTLTVDQGTLTFDSTKTTYNITVPKSTTSIKVGAELADSKSSFVKNYGPRDVKITKDETRILVKVTAENESVKTYTINVKREGTVSSNANISSIILSSGTIALEAGKTTYDVEVDGTVNEFSVNATAEDATAKVDVQGPTTLVTGKNTYTVTVTAENGDKVVYTINVNKSEAVLSSNTNITSVTVGGTQLTFDTTSNAYIANVAQTTALDMTVVLEDTNATYQISGNENLTNGSIIKINVIAQNGTLKEYNVNVNFVEENTGAFDSTMLMYIAIAVALIIVIVIIAVVASKKKKGKAAPVETTPAIETPATPAVEPTAPVETPVAPVEATPEVVPTPEAKPEVPTPVEPATPVVETPEVIAPVAPVQEVETPVVEQPAVQASESTNFQTPAVEETPIAFETPVVEVVSTDQQ